MTDSNLFVVKNVSKRFGATLANNNVSLTIKKGEIRGLAGENGSGKSTLCSIICGIHQKDEGSMHKWGQPYAPTSPIDANSKGVAMVVQELGIIETLSVAENIFLGKTAQFTKRGLLSVEQMNKAAAQELKKWGLDDIDAHTKAGQLSIEQRKLVELVRALSVNPEVLILDEISQALSHDKRELLYRLIDKCTDLGMTIIVVTHDIHEMLELTDSITVLRDGSVVGTVESKDLTESELKRMMVGRELSESLYRNDEQENQGGEVVLSVSQLSDAKLRDISFELRRGEILAVCGLSDGGTHELGEAIFGIRENRTGSVVANVSGKQLNKPIDVIKNRGAYVPKDRDDHGLMLNASVRDNLLVPSARRLAALKNAFGFIAPKRVRALTKEAVDTMSIKTHDANIQKVGSLSGGNKQKVSLAKWLVQNLDFLILDCPTRGVDVGVKGYIYEKMLEATKEGLAILMITEELAEAIGMADRILVLKDGAAVRTFTRSEGFTEEKIVEVMM
ncbi:MAG: sugar ABC transporter ATP-binding protein [Limnochordia bacterium]|jgi:ribose transport system ATP-binding protein|nr:sugar ABC transporter ATP-binding protein [Bacillota bacterium]NLL08255.1 sugar ABC transporter ATP-binding protein [Bacillota bacterium]